MYARVTPTGTIRYNPDKCWNGLTVIPALYGQGRAKGAALYDMNGNVVNFWPGLYGGFDNKILPGGQIMGTTAFVGGYWLDGQNLTQMDWDGNVLWSYNKGEELLDLHKNEKVWSARLHHDYQRQGSPTGYYCPGQLPKERGITLVNSSRTRKIPELSTTYDVCDTLLVEIDEDGKILWEWSLYDHWDQLGLAASAKDVVKSNDAVTDGGSQLKDIYCNCISYIGPNRWYDAGDQRFHPENLITDIRVLNVSFIIEKKTGNVVWRMGPDFVYNKELQEIGQIIGQHHFHVIPKGLPGEGNVLIFDNGGQAGIGLPTASSLSGYNNVTRGYSRVLEIDPVTMKVVWSFNNRHTKHGVHSDGAWSQLLYSEYCSSADRLPNGNTLITETCGGRAIEVTADGEIVWEFINPGGAFFRAHRYPYDWFPIKSKPQEEAVTPPRNMQLRLAPDGQPKLVPADDKMYIVD